MNAQNLLDTVAQNGMLAASNGWPRKPPVNYPLDLQLIWSIAYDDEMRFRNERSQTMGDKVNG